MSAFNGDIGAFGIKQIITDDVSVKELLDGVLRSKKYFGQFCTGIFVTTPPVRIESPRLLTAPGGVEK